MTVTTMTWTDRFRTYAPKPLTIVLTDTDPPEQFTFILEKPMSAASTKKSAHSGQQPATNDASHRHTVAQVAARQNQKLGTQKAGDRRSTGSQGGIAPSAQK